MEVGSREALSTTQAVEQNFMPSHFYPDSKLLSIYLSPIFGQFLYNVLRLSFPDNSTVVSFY